MVVFPEIAPAPLPTGALAGLAGALGFSTLAFLLLHWAMARGNRRGFRANLKLSRGIAASVLVGTGIASLVRWWPLGSQGFVAVHPNPWDAWPVVIFAGHLLADLLWIVGGRLAVDARVARDLVLHHLLGVAVCVAALWLQAGYAVIGVVLLSEILPVLTGVGALARAWALENLERWVLSTSRGAILLVRLPLWLALAWTFTTALLAPGAPEILATVAPVFFPGVVLVVALDLYWIRTYRRLLGEFPRRGVADLSLDPLAPWTLEGS